MTEGTRAGVPTKSHLKNHAGLVAADRQAAKAQANAALREDAELVSYWHPPAGSSSYTSTPEISVENRSNGLLTNVTVLFPIPSLNPSTAPAIPGAGKAECAVGIHLRAVADEGIDVLPGCKGYAYYDLRDVPPCTIQETPVLNSIESPRITFAEIGESELFFTDPNGNS